MADSYSKKEREKKRRKRKQDKADKKLQKKLDGNKQVEFMYVDEDGNLTSTPPDRSKKTETKLEDIQISTPSNADLPPEDPLKKGTVKFFNTEKRFGFIKEATTGADFFVHEERLNDTITEGDKVSFELESGPKGLVAVNVSVVQ